MKTNAIREAMGLVTHPIGSAVRTDLVRRAMAELSELSEVQKALVRACAAVVYRQGDADSREALAREALRKAGVPL